MTTIEAPKKLEELLPQGDVGLLQTMRCLLEALRDPSDRLFDAFTAEAIVFNLLRKAGVEHIRAIEGAPVDGALVCRVDSNDDAEVPLQDYANLEGWCKEHNVRFVPFDVKYVRLSNGIQTLEYGMSAHSASQIRYRGGQPAEFFIVMFEGVFDHVAIIPQESWLRARGVKRGALELVNGVPAWYTKFMVAIDPIEDLSDACSSMVSAAMNGTIYQNPTTKLQCYGFKPTSTTNPAIYESKDERKQVLNDTYIRLCGLFRSVHCRMRLNPVAPFFFDFLIDFPDVGSLRFEHKYCSMPVVNLRTSWPFRGQGRKSPFAPHRIWHVFWMDLQVGEIICIMRDEVDPEWWNTGLTKETIQKFVFSTFADAAEHVRQHADAARHKADACMHELPPDSMDVEFLLNTRKRAKRFLVQHEYETEPPSQKIDLGLEWLCRQLNYEFRRTGRGLLFPMDFAHPTGNHILANYSWTEEVGAEYDTTGELPLRAYSRGLCHNEVRCIVLRLQDHSVKPSEIGSSGSLDRRHFPIMMRPEFWMKPLAPPEPNTVSEMMPHFIIVGSVLDSALLKQVEERSSWYLVLPSGLTTTHDSDQYRQMPKNEFKEKGGHLFLAARPEYTRRPMKIGPKTYEGPVSFNDPFVSKGINIMRYVINLRNGTLARQLLDILTTDGSVAILNPQSSNPNRAFDTSLYHTTLQAQHQASWDFGLVRRIRNLKVEDEGRLAPLDTVFHPGREVKAEGEDAS